MKPTARHATTFGLGAFTLSCVAFVAQAQSPGPTGSFAAQSGAEMQANRTAQLLAASQQQARGTVYTSNPAMTRLGDNFVVTRESRTDNTLLPQARAEVYAPAPPAAMTMQTAPVYREPLPPPAPVYLDRVNVTAAPQSNVIPAMPDARPGECFALVKLPERFQTVQQEYEARAASERIEAIPPRYENVTEQFVAQEAYERVEVVPAQFRMVTEQVEVAAPSSQYVASEPVYETVTERVLETPARSVWKPGRGAIERIDNATGDIMCLVEEPAVYRSITRRVLKAPAAVREVGVPGQYQLVSRRVLERPAEVRRVVVPQQVATRTVRKLAEPGSTRRIAIPAQVGTMSVRELVEPSRLEWRAVLCETNMTTVNIRRVQMALQREGFDPGATDGRLGGSTMAALNAYQRARRLPEDQYLNLETVRALGVM